MGDFTSKVFEQVARIPRGKVSTYGQIARLMGSPRSARYVGFALRRNPSPGTHEGSIPCHRVVFGDGSLCKSFAFGGPNEQRRMLEEEGIGFTLNDCVDLDKHLWNPGEKDLRERIPNGKNPNQIAPKKETLRKEAPNERETGEPTAPPSDFDWHHEPGDI